MKLINKQVAIKILMVFSFLSCKKFIDIDAPPTSLNTDNVFLNDATAASVLTGAYARISNNDEFNSSDGVTSLSLYTGLSSDELTLYNVNSPNLLPYYTNDLTPSTQSGNFWKNFYQLIFIANSAIEGLDRSSSLTIKVKQQLTGEARFIRGFSYYYLVNLYSDVPLVLSSDYKVNTSLKRNSYKDVCTQIIEDLLIADSLLSEDYLRSDAMTSYPDQLKAERVRPTKWAAKALLARMFLQLEDWVNAERYSIQILNNTSQFGLVQPAMVFLKNSTESIWQIQPTGTTSRSNTGQGAMFVLPIEGPNIGDYPVYLNDSLVHSFEKQDLRMKEWIDSVKPNNKPYYYSKKYRVGRINSSTKEYIMMLRLGEQYLIHAEALVKQNRISEAMSDLSKIRGRAGINTALNSNADSLFKSIQVERLHELFTEWGDRWITLKRQKLIDDVMGPLAIKKGGTWSSYKSLYPIPQEELSKAPNLEQNPGYNQ